MGLRRKGREIALQTFYALSFSGENDVDLSIFEAKLEEISSSKEHELDNKILEFSKEILANTIANITAIDEKIAEHSTNWKMSKIAMVDLSILRIATYELLFTSTPPAIIMNEAIEIAKRYSSESSSKFVNGILNSITAELA
ncbi:MAG: transcription antitermination factor NusB [Candidatus Cloacimonetes bacterium]|nr:transcription antitermination factor NusB [Candidatus Cloacimonadota bacterium]MCF7814570.1 transcription antitermination factor NusB [Candidatus Cloacimonadota bacterium]MCF7867764.1 transcription antitermination factor NusB [Candidatus Cloacimonadota bacterium]MCF7883258.1 transcription antitermination factor NusB [Candidatus Cloacimonadota bacterium]